MHTKCDKTIFERKNKTSKNKTKLQQKEKTKLNILL